MQRNDWGRGSAEEGIAFERGIDRIALRATELRRGRDDRTRAHDRLLDEALDLLHVLERALRHRVAEIDHARLELDELRSLLAHREHADDARTGGCDASEHARSGGPDLRGCAAAARRVDNFASAE